MAKRSFTEVNLFLKGLGSELIEYTSSSKPFKFKCSKCASIERYSNFSTFKKKHKGAFCKHCQFKRVGEKNSLGMIKIKSFFLNAGSKLLSEYKNNRTKIEFICATCGDSTSRESFSSLKKNNPKCLCYKCMGVLISLDKRTKIKEMVDYFLKHNSKLLEPFPTTGSKNLHFICSRCKEVGSYNGFFNLRYYNSHCLCIKCQRVKLSCYNNINFNPNISNKERGKRRSDIFKGYRTWTLNVIKQSNHRCIFTQSKSSMICPHHLYNFADYPQLRPFIWNGVSIDKKLHKEFHSLYGYGKNTFIQFKSFIWDKFKKHFYLIKTKDLIVDVIPPEFHPFSLKDSFSKRGILYIPIFETEILQKPEIINSILSNRRGNNLIKMGARELTLKINSPFLVVNEFLSQNHRQGFVPSTINIGLFKEKELISLMTFGVSRFNKRYQYELYRFCSKLGYTVAGGASKLFNSFLKNFKPKSIISYGDYRFSSKKKNLYLNLGFNFTGISKPNYWYFKEGVLHSRLKFQKHKLPTLFEGLDLSKSEVQIMTDQGFQRYFDCGNLKFIKEF